MITAGSRFPLQLLRLPAANPQSRPFAFITHLGDNSRCWFTCSFIDVLVGILSMWQNPGPLRRRNVTREDVSVTLASRKVCGLLTNDCCGLGRPIPAWLITAGLMVLVVIRKQAERAMGEMTVTSTLLWPPYLLLPPGSQPVWPPSRMGCNWHIHFIQTFPVSAVIGQCFI